MKVRILPNAAEASRFVAALIADRLKVEPASVLGLPTGRTLVWVYDELVRLHGEGEVDFSQAQTFNVDEFIGLSACDRRSFRGFMDRRLFSRVNIAARQIHFLDGVAEDLDAECARF